MAEWRPVNIATITEEKVDGEEVGEDGTVSRTLTRCLSNFRYVFQPFITHLREISA